jgi:CRP-like cAMP-binding protein
MIPDHEHTARPERHLGREQGGLSGPAGRDATPAVGATDVARDDAAGDATGPTAAAPRNRVLGALPPEEYARLLPHLEPVTVATLEVLADAGRPLGYVYFPETAVIAVARRLRDGSMIEAYAVGREGVVGVPAVLGDPGSPADTILGEVSGLCRRMPVAALRALLPALPALDGLLRRLLLAVLDQVQQAVACNSLHTVEQRCARWLLQAHDRVGGGAVELTHEVLAQLLAVRRAGVTVSAGEFQRAGLITYRRGQVRVLDRAGLEAAACECYAVVRAHSERLLSEEGRR